jgi:hypothetical protein
MKYFRTAFLTFVIAFIFVSCKSANKASNCKDIHTGEFYFYPKTFGKKYKIIRDEKIQKEVAIGTSDTSVSRINWVDDCTYSLDHISGGAKIPGNKQHRVFIQFFDITKNYYVVKMCADSLNSKYCLKDTIWVNPRQ